MKTNTLANLAGDVACAVVDGERANALEPRESALRHVYTAADVIAREAGISSDSPRYSGMHHHCQYSRTG